MNARNELWLHEEILLLAIRDEKGTFSAGYVEYVVASAILAELLLADRIRIGDSKKRLVDVIDSMPMGDSIIDLGLEKLRDAKRRAALQTWVSRIAGIRKLRHLVAETLCRKGILRLDEKKVLFLFTQPVYPEVNGEPEREVKRRLERAIFSDDDTVDARTTVLISLMNAIRMLDQIFGRGRVKPQKKRIEEIIEGERLGVAAKQVIEACESAAAAAIVVSTVIAASAK